MANQFHIIAAGSLLGIKTKEHHGFPVGKVNFLHMHPLSFMEFLSALGHEKLREHLESLTKTHSIEEALHLKLINLLKDYLYVGGMPEVVYEYTKSQDYNIVREIPK